MRKEQGQFKFCVYLSTYDYRDVNKFPMFCQADETGPMSLYDVDI